MENDFDQGQEIIYSNKVRAGKRRTYFFDVRRTKSEDYYITLTESTKRFNGDGFTRHKIFLYKEDFNRFVEGLNDAVSHVKSELMPDYDYEQFDRMHEEWDAERKLENENAADHKPKSPAPPKAEESSTEIDSEEDIKW